jgi:hypothetical protein
VGYNFFSVYLLIVSVVMLRSSIFGRVTAYVGLLAAIPKWGLYVPKIGIFLSIFGVFPFFAIRNVLIVRRLFQLGRGVSKEEVEPQQP